MSRLPSETVITESRFFVKISKMTMSMVKIFIQLIFWRLKTTFPIPKIKTSQANKFQGMRRPLGKTVIIQKKHSPSKAFGALKQLFLNTQNEN